MRGKRFALFLLMIAIGVGLGLLYGWVLNPVKYEDTTPSMLRSDYKADYVLMIAEIYNTDQNLEQATRRLAALESLPPARIVSAANLTARELGYADRDLELINKLSQALQKAAPLETSAPTVRATGSAAPITSATATDGAITTSVPTATPGGQP